MTPLEDAAAPGRPKQGTAPQGGSEAHEVASVGAILIVKLSSLGDVIQTMPVVHDLQQAFPHARIDWVVEEAFAPLVQRVRGLRRVLPMAERRWRKTRWNADTRQERAAFVAELQKENYDAVIDCQGLIKSALVARRALLAPGGFRATFGNASELCSYEWPVRWLLDTLVPMPQRIHAVARTRALAAGALNFTPSAVPVYALQTQGGPSQRAVVLAHGTTRPDNEWLEACWTELGRRLVQHGLDVWLPQAGGAELALAQRLAAAIGPQASVWPKLSLAEVLDRMATSAGVVGVDSGLSHLAVALDLPHVQIFSQPRVWRAGPLGRAHQRAVGGDAAPDVDAVWHAWQQVLAAAPQTA
ncbi:MAG: lipopolysaccharide heptosyltransferase I [Pseudomonadota bacterium]